VFVLSSFFRLVTILVLHSNIMLPLTHLVGTNALAYFAPVSATKKNKKFCNADTWQAGTQAALIPFCETCRKCHKTLYDRNLRMFAISWSIRPRSPYQPGIMFET